MSALGEFIRAMKEENIKVKKLRADNKIMVELLGRIYMDVDQTNGSLYWDTIRKLKEWVNGQETIDT